MLPFCPRCGVESKPGRASCWNCWAPLDEPQPKGKKGKQPAPPKRSPRDLEEAPVLFLFNASALPEEADGGYGAYAETQLLRQLFTRWIEDGAGDAAGITVKACHGDLYEEHELGPDACTVKQLAHLLKEKSTDGALLSATLHNPLKKGKPLGFIPYAVGLVPVRRSIMVAMDKELKSRKDAFYLGVVRFAVSADFEDIAATLALPQTLEISQGLCLGDWNGAAPDMADLPPVPTSAASAALLDDAAGDSVATPPATEEAAPAEVEKPKKSLFGKKAKAEVATQEAAPTPEKPKKSLFGKKGKVEAEVAPEEAAPAEAAPEKPKKSLFAKKPKAEAAADEAAPAEDAKPKKSLFGIGGKKN